jgi:hypothetical protein
VRGVGLLKALAFLAGLGLMTVEHTGVLQNSVDAGGTLRHEVNGEKKRK